jgi:hypothetical protein
MPDHASLNDVKDVWRNQMTEAPQISLQRFRRKAHKLQKKARREVYALSALAAILVSSFLFALTQTQGTVQRIGLGLLAGWALLLPFQAHRMLRQTPLAFDSTLATGIDFYRKQLERHRDYHTHIWRWGVVPFLLGGAVYGWPVIVGLAANPELLPNILPFSVLLVVWVAAFFYLRRRRVQKLRRKLDILDELQREIPS